MAAPGDKKLTDRQLLGGSGTSLIDLVISKMGFVWRPTAQHDAGIDGEIEVREPTTVRMTGLLIKVQSKAVSAFANETDEGFDYWPEAFSRAFSCFKRLNSASEKDEEVERSIPFVKAYAVFNVAQIEGIPARSTEPAAPAMKHAPLS